MKLITRLAVCLSAVAVAVVGVAAPASAAVSPTAIYVGGGSGNTAVCTTASSVGAYSNSGQTTAVTSFSGTAGSFTINNVCSDYAIYVTFGTSTFSIPGTAFNGGAYSSTSATVVSSDTVLTLYRCAYVAGNAGTAGGCISPSDRTLVTTYPISVTSVDVTATGSNASTTLSRSSITKAAAATFTVQNDGSDTLVITSNTGTVSVGGTNCVAISAPCNVSSGSLATLTVVSGGTIALGSRTFTINAGGGGGSSSSASASPQTLTLQVAASGASCVGGDPSGVAGSWLTLPGADQCTHTGSTVTSGATLLGWSTSANFPRARAQAQVDKRWGVIDEVIDGVRMIFIPGGMAVFVSGPNNLYPVWSK
jgi:hypothetical protein